MRSMGSVCLLNKDLSLERQALDFRTAKPFRARIVNSASLIRRWGSEYRSHVGLGWARVIILRPQQQRGSVYYCSSVRGATLGVVLLSSRRHNIGVHLERSATQRGVCE